ncbi:recombinase family protein [Caulobacter sp. Root487D2Y]|uniref:recombinase family protein n=1 Tax=Caulobacter sp. Root487D2Y TaxID=1736547 RepID=UPI000ACC8798|nr:recombinase family protein [Caulobacter sp. Root487D2Y]
MKKETLTTLNDYSGLRVSDYSLRIRLMIYGYARVSTDGQSVAAQVAELTVAGCEKVFSETASGAKTDRTQLKKAIASLGAGDVLVVTRLDRLARSTRDLLNVLAALAEKDAQFRSIRDTWADTTTSHGRLMLTVLGGLAEFERDLIRSRTAEGRERAKARGVKLGRRHSLTVAQRAFVAQQRANGESVRHLARVLGVSKATIGRIPASDG